MLQVKCYIGKREFKREELKEITINDKVINNIIAQVNGRSAEQEQNNG